MNHVNRREFVLGLAAGTFGLGTTAYGIGTRRTTGPFCCWGNYPVDCIADHKLDVLVAFVEAQLHALWGRLPDEDPRAVAMDVVRYIEALDKPLQHGMCSVLTWINLYSVRHTGEWLTGLPVAQRMQLLSQGEYQPTANTGNTHKPLPLIVWDRQFVLHTAISSLAMMTRLVTNSRHPARRFIGFSWSPQCQLVDNLVKIEPPAYPDLDQEYDVCVIGSGAGGAVVAARAAEAGMHVLIIEEGEWISPDALVERVSDTNGKETVWPARDDVALTRLFRGAGVNIAGLSLEAKKLMPMNILTNLGQRKPKQMINLVQAKVVGGGPYINNAIHLEPSEEVWNGWGSYKLLGIDYPAFWQRMQQIKRDLGVSPLASANYSGDRSQIFIQGCENANLQAKPLPVSIWVNDHDSQTALGDKSSVDKSSGNKHCSACGSENVVDPFGGHIGGLHPYREEGPNSYLMRAIASPMPAQIAYETRAIRFEFSSDTNHRVQHLVAEDRRETGREESGSMVQVKAKHFVLAAGSVASTKLIRSSLRGSHIRVKGLGQGFTGNVGTAVYAMFDKPVLRANSGRGEPGIAQCYYVEGSKKGPAGSESNAEPTLENWFHYPGTLALALTGWFQEYAAVMNKYDHLSLCGLFVPTKVRSENRIDDQGRVHLQMDREEFELLLRGIKKIGRIYLAAATKQNGVSLYLPTKALLLDDHGRPIKIRNQQQLGSAINEIRKRGPAFLNLATAHPQGGNALGSVVHPTSFKVMDQQEQQIDNLFVADASLFPAGCETNPQLTVKGLAMYAADSLLAQS